MPRAPGILARLLWRRRQPLEDKLLHAIALRLAGHEIAVRIDAEAVEMEELARLASGSGDVADLFKRRPIQDCVRGASVE